MVLGDIKGSSTKVQAEVSPSIKLVENVKSLTSKSKHNSSDSNNKRQKRSSTSSGSNSNTSTTDGSPNVVPQKKQKTASQSSTTSGSGGLSSATSTTLSRAATSSGSAPKIVAVPPTEDEVSIKAGTTWTPDCSFCPFRTDTSYQRKEYNGVLFSLETKMQIENEIERRVKSSKKPNTPALNDAAVLRAFETWGWNPRHVGPCNPELLRKHDVLVNGKTELMLSLKYPLPINIPHSCIVIAKGQLLRTLGKEDETQLQRAVDLEVLETRIKGEISDSMRGLRNYLKVMPIGDPNHPAYQATPDCNGCHGYGCVVYIPQDAVLPGVIRKRKNKKVIAQGSIVGPPYAGVLRTIEETDRLESEVDKSKNETPMTRWTYSFQVEADRDVTALAMAQLRCATSPNHKSSSAEYYYDSEESSDEAAKTTSQEKIKKITPACAFDSGTITMSCVTVSQVSNKIPQALDMSDLNIDAYEVRNLMAYANDPISMETHLNHIPKPESSRVSLEVHSNIVPIDVLVYGIPHVFFVAARELHHGEEALLDYGQLYWDRYSTFQKYIAALQDNMSAVGILQGELSRIEKEKNVIQNEWKRSTVSEKIMESRLSELEVREKHAKDKLEHERMEMNKIQQQYAEDLRDSRVYERRYFGEKLRKFRQVQQFFFKERPSKSTCLLSIVARALHEGELHEISDEDGDDHHYAMHCPFKAKFMPFITSCEKCHSWFIDGLYFRQHHNREECIENVKYEELWIREPSIRTLHEDSTESTTRLAKWGPRLTSCHGLCDAVYNLVNSSPLIIAFLTSHMKRALQAAYENIKEVHLGSWREEIGAELNCHANQIEDYMYKVTNCCMLLLGNKCEGIYMPNTDINSSWIFPFAGKWLDTVTRLRSMTMLSDPPSETSIQKNPVLLDLLSLYSEAEYKIVSGVGSKQRCSEDAIARDKYFHGRPDPPAVPLYKIEFMDLESMHNHFARNIRLFNSGPLLPPESALLNLPCGYKLNTSRTYIRRQNGHSNDSDQPFKREDDVKPSVPPNSYTSRRNSLPYHPGSR